MESQLKEKTVIPTPRPWHVARHMVSGAWALLPLLGVVLLLGMLIYHGVEGLGWPDAFLNAAMLLGGMGPVSAIDTTDGKIFAGLFALYAGLVFLAVTAFVLAPIFHHVLHRFHWETRGQK
jgi:hypothetical protein